MALLISLYTPFTKIDGNIDKNIYPFNGLHQVKPLQLDLYVNHEILKHYHGLILMQIVGYFIKNKQDHCCDSGLAIGYLAKVEVV